MDKLHISFRTRVTGIWVPNILTFLRLRPPCVKKPKENEKCSVCDNLFSSDEMKHYYASKKQYMCFGCGISFMRELVSEEISKEK